MSRKNFERRFIKSNLRNYKLIPIEKEIHKPNLRNYKGNKTLNL